MTLAELRFIVSQQKYNQFYAIFDEHWVTDELLAEALSRMFEKYRNRLIQVIGVDRKDFAQLSLPKLQSGYMKPGYANACYGIQRSLRHLRMSLARLKPKGLEASREVSRKLTCPHCGTELTISLTLS